MPTTKPILPPLKTPKSASFPSELHDDCPSSISDAIKQEEESLNQKSTPITPASSIPSAYKEFLDALTPIFSPASAGVSFKSAFERSGASPTSQPASALSSSFSPRGESVRSPTISLPPPTPASAAASRKAFPVPRRLRIPQSLKYSPTTDTPKSATSFRTPFSPYTPDGLGKALYRYEPPYTAGGQSVSVKQIVTRTVTYKRTQLEAPPKGKRRKCRELKEPKKA